MCAYLTHNSNQSRVGSSVFDKAILFAKHPFNLSSTANKQLFFTIIKPIHFHLNKKCE